MSKNYVETKGDDAIKREPMGTGAYKLKEWVAGDHITLEANENYFQGAPAIKTVTIKPITDKNTGLIALENKEIDAYLNINTSDISIVEGNESLAFYSTDQAAVLMLNMNIEAGPLQNVKVRQALSYAINKDDIIAGALEGIGKPANSPIPPVADGYSADVKGYEHNAEKAKELLKEAGYSDLTLTLKLKEDSKNQKVAQIIQSNLKDAGITVDIDVMESGAYSNEIYVNGNYELSIGSWSGMFLDAYSVIYSQFHKDCNGPTGNITHVKDDELSNLLDEALLAQDEEKVKAYESVVENIYENAYNIPLVFEQTTITTNANLKGVKASPLGIYMFKNLSW
jgi:peptide/nickel transport system substrate-binding protein